MAEGNPAFGEIVRREFQRDAVASQHSDAIPPQATGEVCKYYPILLELYAE